MQISSVDNKKIKEIKKLRNNKFMMEEKRFIIEGEHLVLEALKAGILEEVIALNDKDYGVISTKVTENVMKSISNLPSIPSVIGICKFIKEKKNLGNKILILDGVQDPGNLGTIIRSAYAFNFDTIVLSPTTVKMYNDKVIRATQGMIFNMNIITRDLIPFIKEIKNNDYKVYATDVVNGKSIKDVKAFKKIAVVMGSEGSGVSDEVKLLADSNIYIKMNNDCESLNVAVAASIIMYEMGE